MCQNLRQFTSHTHTSTDTLTYMPPPPHSHSHDKLLVHCSCGTQKACFQKVGDQTCSDVGVRETKGTERDIIQRNVWRQDGETGNMQVQDVISASFLV